MKHFELTSETKTHLGRKLFRIKCTVDCKWANKGDLGGWVEKEDNLSDSAWVSGNALVYGNARVSDNARVYGNALVYDSALVSGNAQVSGNALVYGNPRVYDSAWVSGNALVYGNARVYDNARVSPISITNLKYQTTITDNHLRVGCEMHTFEEWNKFSDNRILAMEGKEALKWWKAHKPLIMGIIKENRS